MATIPKKGGKRPARKTAATPPHETIIEYLNGDGIGVVREHGKELWVPGTLPGESVKVHIQHEGQRRRMGELVKVMRNSPQRTTPA
ncbi:MAG: 23S rRNA (uracil(1939)-C(5))-methyltransferase RlmD, partial [Desulfuromonadaceae bacterium]